MSLYLELYRITVLHPDKPALIEKDNIITYKQLLNEVDIVAKNLARMGLKRDDKIGMLCLNQSEYVKILFAANKIGVIIVPVNIMQTQDVIFRILLEAGIKVLCISSEILQMAGGLSTKLHFIPIKVIIFGNKPKGLERFPDFDSLLQQTDIEVNTVEDPEQPAVLLYTSGTTGLPKGVLLSNENLITNINDFCSLCQLPDGAKSILVLPLFHSFGQIVLLVCILNNISSILIKVFSPSTILRIINSQKPEVLSLVPTMFDVLVDASIKKSIPLDSIKYCITGGSTISADLIDKIKLTTGSCIIEGYGLTETSPVIAVSHSEEFCKPHSVGKPLPSVNIKICEDGEILVKGKSIFKNYHKRPDETNLCFTDEGYFRTGDIGTMDEDGFLYITGRKKDLIIRAGENISPKQIEDEILAVKGVKGVAVFGVPAEKIGEAVYCALELDESGNLEDITSHCKKMLPSHLVPEKFIVMSELPRSSLGKILKYKLKEEYYKQNRQKV